MAGFRSSAITEVTNWYGDVCRPKERHSSFCPGASKNALRLSEVVGSVTSQRQGWLVSRRPQVPLWPSAVVQLAPQVHSGPTGITPEAPVRLASRSARKVWKSIGPMSGAVEKTVPPAARSVILPMMYCDVRSMTLWRQLPGDNTPARSTQLFKLCRAGGTFLKNAEWRYAKAGG